MKQTKTQKMKCKILIITLFLIILTSIVFSLLNRNKKPDFFRRQDKKLLENNKAYIFYINIDSVLKTVSGQDGYFFKSAHFDNGTIEIEGIVLLKDNCVFLNLKDIPGEFKLFDFNFEVGKCETIYHKLNDFYKIKKYKLCLIDKFYDTEANDSIYQFKLEDFGISFKNDDIGLFVGKEIGIQGLYLGDIYEDNVTNKNIEIYYYSLGNIHKERTYFKNLIPKVLR
jgi:hypothetical protein